MKIPLLTGIAVNLHSTKMQVGEYGQFGGEGNRPEQLIPVARDVRPCPYCTEPLKRFDPSGRLSRLVKRTEWQAIVQAVPSTHYIESCTTSEGCGAIFTVLKSEAP